jgi:hypothetical protein
MPHRETEFPGSDLDGGRRLTRVEPRIIGETGN